MQRDNPPLIDAVVSLCFLQDELSQLDIPPGLEDLIKVLLDSAALLATTLGQLSDAVTREVTVENFWINLEKALIKDGIEIPDWGTHGKPECRNQKTPGKPDRDGRASRRRPGGTGRKRGPRC